TFTADMPVFPGDPAPDLVEFNTVAKDGVSHFELKTQMHVGTHIDAPAHFMAGGKLLDEYPPQKFFGRGVIVDARSKTSAGPELLSALNIQKGDVVLVYFDWSSEFRNEDYYRNYPVLSNEFAQKLGELGVSIVGMDTPSPDRAPYQAHKILFKSDILIIESLTNLEQLIGKSFEIIALPPKLQAEAAPCRVVAKIHE
ncbi:MAG: cyclase family protein, partial [Candidatus Paceibacterales bacterium]